MSRNALETTQTQADKRGSPDNAPRRAAPFLFVALHCDAPILGGARYGLANLERVVIMRGGAREARRGAVQQERVMELVLPGTFVSRVHAEMSRVGDQWLVVDAGARNGTFVNGERVSRAFLADGDIIECGHTMLVYRAGLSRADDVPDDRDYGETAPPLATLVPELEGRNALLGRVASSALPVLLLGETGTGKEVSAYAVHALSQRSGPFVPVNCGAIPASILEAQLFGHVKGAFSGATRDEPGFFRAANGGTLFLDELGELPLASQAAFLRATEERAVTPVGSTRPIPVDVRVVSATNRALSALVARGTFREDLLARLSAYKHVLPPLRERIVDLGLLAGAILRERAAERVAIETDAGLAMLRHAWPRNVRELRNVLDAALVLAGDAPLSRAQLEPLLDLPRGAAPEDDDDELRSRLMAELKRHKGNVAAAARALGKGPTQIRRWMRRYDLDPETFRT